VKRRLSTFFALFAAAAMLEACQGGSASVPTVDSPFWTVTTNSTTVTLTPGGAPVSAALPSSHGVSGALTLPAPTSTTTATLTETIQNFPPPAEDGVPALSSRRVPAGTRQSVAQLPHSTILYIRLIADQVIRLPNSPTFSLTLPSNLLVPGASYYVASYNDAQQPNDWNLSWEGPGTVSGSTIAFTTNGLGAFTFAAGVKYWFALVATGVPIPTPTPTPTPTATPTPTPGPFGALPAGVAFTNVGQAATIAVSDDPGLGVTATSANTAVAAVSPASATTNGSGAASVTITSGATAGATTVTIRDSLGRTAAVTVSVTLTNGTIQ
jgi:hypothetical protein